MIPKGAIRINPNDGLYCKNCRTYCYGDPKKIRKKHVCKKLIKRRKYLLFGTIKYTSIPMKGEPDLIPIEQHKREMMLK